jgi:hypothetical protein
LGDFDDAEFRHNGIITRFSRDGTAFQVEADGLAGQPVTYPVTGVAGVEPLQQYLVEAEPGRQQALDIAWDVERHRWYHLYPDSGLKAGDGLHWTGPYKTWNARCAECHATGYEKRFDPDTRRYDSRQAEIGVGCEACHGPGSGHVDWAGGKTVDAPGHTESGLVLAFSATEPEVEIQQCAGCHARREPFGADSPLPGTLFHERLRTKSTSTAHSCSRRCIRRACAVPIATIRIMLVRWQTRTQFAPSAIRPLEICASRRSALPRTTIRHTISTPRGPMGPRARPAI